MLYSSPMNFRRLLVSSLTLVLAGSMGLTGCQSLWPKKKSKVVKPSEHNMADQNSDATFQAFLGRLRKAIAKRDTAMLITMMSADFGYSWSPGGEGPGVFDFWDKNNLWPEVDSVLREKFVPSGDFMVAPAQVTFNPDYKGFRAGLRQVNGSWRFSYFVSAPPAAVPASQ